MNATKVLCPVILAALTFGSCGKKQENNEIIVEKIVEKPQSEPTRMAKVNETKDVKWVDANTYHYTISREPIDSLGYVESYGEIYCNNTIHLTIKRSDNTEFFTKSLTKNSFSGLLNNDLKEHGVLINLVLDKADKDNLYFVATIGAPDETQENFVLLQYIVSRMGSTSVAIYNPPVM